MEENNQEIEQVNTSEIIQNDIVAVPKTIRTRRKIQDAEATIEESTESAIVEDEEILNEAKADEFSFENQEVTEDLSLTEDANSIQVITDNDKKKKKKKRKKKTKKIKNKEKKKNKKKKNKKKEKRKNVKKAKAKAKRAKKNKNKKK